MHNYSSAVLHGLFVTGIARLWRHCPLAGWPRQIEATWDAGDTGTGMGTKAWNQNCQSGKAFDPARH